ncbi:hypothetical protein [Robbsia andropogonis]|uniref:hypothetical protein n=1 Tax=Robbsia andropogonis TaxID=28092 RepID=UPI001C914462|nr:hypothetical protein [Robbsia andropogonis]
MPPITAAIQSELASKSPPQYSHVDANALALDMPFSIQHDTTPARKLAKERGSASFGEERVSIRRSVGPQAVSTAHAENERITSIVLNPDMPNLKKADLIPGDILLLIDEPHDTEKLHKIIIAGQKLEGLSMMRKNVGKASVVHAILWTRNSHNPVATEPGGMGDSEVVEMRGGGIMDTALRKGLYQVYRPKDKNIGDWAAQIAMLWSSERKIPYNAVKSAKSVTRFSNFGPLAIASAKKYSKDAFDANPKWGSGGAFCSHLILATYQAAAQNTGTPLSGALKVDAKGCSVRTLSHFLKKDTNQFDFSGHLRIKPDDVLFPED